mgnify:CR=1 FL=1
MCLVRGRPRETALIALQDDLVQTAESRGRRETDIAATRVAAARVPTCAFVECFGFRYPCVAGSASGGRPTDVIPAKCDSRDCAGAYPRRRCRAALLGAGGSRSLPTTQRWRRQKCLLCSQAPRRCPANQPRRCANPIRVRCAKPILKARGNDRT